MLVRARAALPAALLLLGLAGAARAQDPAATAEEAGSRWLIVAGLNETGDMEIPGRTDSEYYAWSFANRMLAEDFGAVPVDHAGVLLGVDASKANLEQAFAAAAQGAKEDVLFVYLCLTPVLTRGEDGAVRVVLCTRGVEQSNLNTAGFTIDRLVELLATVPAERKVVLLDFSPWDAWKPQDAPADLVAPEDCYAKLAQVCAYVSAASPGEKLAEEDLKRPFLGYCLSNAPDGLLVEPEVENGDGEIVVSELWAFIKSVAGRVFANGPKQTPVAAGTPLAPTRLMWADERGETCPAGMRLVGGHVCVDIYEAPNLVGAMPLANQNLFGFSGWCQQRGKRACEPEEWEEACLGPDSLRFGYGEMPIMGACNIGWADIETAKAERIGSRPLCVNGYGLYDMVGSVGEYVGHGNVTSDVRGGSFRDGEINRIDCRTGGPHHPVMQSDHVGMRCCADPKSEGGGGGGGRRGRRAG